MAESSGNELRKRIKKLSRIAKEREQTFALSRLDSEIEMIELFRSAGRYTEAKYTATYLLKHVADVERFEGMQESLALLQVDVCSYANRILALPDTVSTADRSALMLARKNEPPGPERYAVGTRVRIAPLSVLEEFKKTWQFHHPLDDAQMQYAGTEMRVWDVSYYHGGDVLYVLDGAEGCVWHERCLEPTDY